MWPVINKIINKRKHKPITINFLVGDREISDSEDIVEHFNNCSCNVAKKYRLKYQSKQKKPPRISSTQIWIIFPRS